MKPILIAIALFLGLLSTLSAAAAGRGGDITPPVLVDAQLDRNQIDTMYSAQTVTLTLHVTDDLSGLRYAQIRYVQHFGYNASRSCDVWMYEEPSTDVTIPCGVSFPRYSAEGVWQVETIYMEDRVGNRIETRTSECQIWKDSQCLEYAYTQAATDLVRSMEITIGSEGDPHVFLPTIWQ